MASIDWARAYLTEGAGGAAYRAVAAETARLRAQINKRGVFRAPVRSGRRFPRPHPADGGHGPRWFVRRPGRKHLEQDYNIWPEMTDRDRVVCILTCADTAEELERLGSGLCGAGAVCSGSALPPYPPPPAPRMRRRIREAVFAPRRMLCAESGRGLRQRIVDRALPARRQRSGSGEEITREIIEYLAAVGYDVSAPVPVLKEPGFVGKETL